MDIPPLEAHSVAEAHLYLMVTPCKLCGTGRTRCVESHLGPALDGTPPRPTLVISTECEGCRFHSDFAFAFPAGETLSDAAAPARINPTGAPSQIIDVAQWLTLFHVVTQAAAAQTDKIETRVLGYEAAQCLEEALKFYQPDNDLPPESAFFCESSRRQWREHSERFARSRLVGMRARLPTLTDMEKKLMSGGAPRARQWWKVW